MAKKGQTFKKYTKETKEEILRKHLKNIFPQKYWEKRMGYPRKRLKIGCINRSKGKPF